MVRLALSEMSLGPRAGYRRGHKHQPAPPCPPHQLRKSTSDVVEVRRIEWRALSHRRSVWPAYGLVLLLQGDGASGSCSRRPRWLPCVVQQTHGLLDDLFYKGLRASAMRCGRPRLRRGEHLARAGDQEGQPVQVLQSGPAGRKSRSLDLDRATTSMSSMMRSALGP